MEALLLQAQFRWAGHLVRMSDNRIPKQIFYGQLESGMRLPWRARQTVQGHSQDQPQAMWNQPKPAKQCRNEPIILAFRVSSSD